MKTSSDETHRKHRQVGSSQQRQERLQAAVLDHQVSVVRSITWWDEKKKHKTTTSTSCLHRNNVADPSSFRFCYVPPEGAVYSESAARYLASTVPAMLPSAQMACSLMCGCGEDTRLMKAGMAPPSTTAVVWSDVPEAMLVSAQAASNWIGGHWGRARKLTNL